jgi:hypothetical protein
MFNSNDFYAGTTIPLSYLIEEREKKEREIFKKSITSTIEDYDEILQMMESVPGNTYCPSLWFDHRWTSFTFRKFKNTMRTLVYNANKRDHLNEEAVRLRHMEMAERRIPTGRKSKHFYSCLAHAPGRSWMTGTPRK